MCIVEDLGALVKTKQRGSEEYVFGLGQLPLEQRAVTFSLGACRRIWLQIEETSRDGSVNI